MKKTIILAAIASVALASCVKNEVLSPTVQNDVQEPISFTAMAASPTKAAVAGEIGTTYNTGEQFTVFAAWTDAAYPGTGTPTVFMAGADAKDRCTYDGTLVAWKPAVTYYWPKNGYLTFAAFSPADAKDDCTPSYTWAASGTGGLTLTDFTVQANIEDQYDLMYADREYNKIKGHYDNTHNGATSTGGTGLDDEDDDAQADGYTYAYNGVNLRFHHALSSIKFQVKTKVDYSANATIVIKGITLKNAYGTATFTENVAEGASYSAAPAWGSYNATKVNYVISNADQTVTSTLTALTLANSATAVILLPQDLTAGTKPSLFINYTIAQNGGDPVPQTAEFVLDNYKHSDTSTEEKKWVMGKRYIYTIVFGLDQIYFDPAVEAWANEYTVTPDMEVL